MVGPLENLHELQCLSPVILEITFAQALHWPQGRYIEPHRHNEEFQLDLFNGNGRLEIDGQEMPLVGWTVVFIPPRMEHSFRASTTDRLRNIGIKFLAATPRFPPVPFMCRVLKVERTRQNIEETLQVILVEWQMRRLGWELAISHRVVSLLVELLRVLYEQDNPPDQHDILQEACRFMSLNYSEPIRFSDVARHCRIHPASLSRLFRRHLKKSPRAYLLDLRLKQACVLLGSGFRITQVAEQTGFSSIHHFSHAFKKRLSCSPTGWQPTFGYEK